MTKKYYKIEKKELDEIIDFCKEQYKRHANVSELQRNLATTMIDQNSKREMNEMANNNSIVSCYYEELCWKLIRLIDIDVLDLSELENDK